MHVIYIGYMTDSVTFGLALNFHFASCFLQEKRRKVLRCSAFASSQAYRHRSVLSITPPTTQLRGLEAKNRLQKASGMWLICVCACYICPFNIRFLSKLAYNVSALTDNAPQKDCRLGSKRQCAQYATYSAQCSDVKKKASGGSKSRPYLIHVVACLRYMPLACIAHRITIAKWVGDASMEKKLKKQACTFTNIHAQYKKRQDGKKNARQELQLMSELVSWCRLLLWDLLRHPPHHNRSAVAQNTIEVKATARTLFSW